ncbi:MAG TPA: STAS domain-containing protein [bacterium]|nr:STAS domain-containing protein [bacterium]
MLRVELHNESGVNIIKLSGDLSHDTIQQLQQDIEYAVEGNSGSVIFDMSDLDFVDSKGAGFLVRYSNSLQGRKVGLANLPDNIRNVLMRLNIVEQFRTFSSLGDAVRRI